MSQSKVQPNLDSLPGLEVLTLPEAAAFLRSSDKSVMELVDKAALPAQRIGGEWRFLKQALVEFLRYGPHNSSDRKMFAAPWVFDQPFWEGVLWALEQNIMRQLPDHDNASEKPGSKQAVLKHFGVFKDDDDLDSQLANIHSRREAAGE